MSEAQVFKTHAWKLAGLHRTPTYDHYPPRKITILTRHGRGIFNLDMVVEAVEQTGILYEVRSDLGALTWAEQVRLMAGTGIFISVHGGAMVNSIYMPANAVVIEIHPRMYRTYIFRDIASRAGLQYFGINGLTPNMSDPANVERAIKYGDPGVDVLKDAAFVENCDAPHVSSLESCNIGDCAHRAKWTSPYVDPDEFRRVLRDAIDDIGCRDSYCHYTDNITRERTVVDMRANKTLQVHR